MATTRPTKEPTGRLWVEPGEQKTGLIARVAPETPVFKTYSFAVPPEMAESLQLGQRVMIPAGRRGRLTRGFVVSLDQGPWDSTLRPIRSLVDPESFLPPDLVDLATEIAGHYHCPLGRTLKAITPEAVRQGRGLRKVLYVRLPDAPPATETNGAPAARRPSAQRRAVLDALSLAAAPVRLDDLMRQPGATRALVRKMAADRMLVIEERREEGAETDQPALAAEPDFLLNADQQAALDAIQTAIAAETFRVLLLYGVSGSGKTEVYIHTIRRVIAAGRQAILMVPEIVLTTQLVSRLAARLPRVAVMHSGLPEAQRSIMWRRIAAGDRTVVVGTRSAVFAPCPNLGLIVVDEEQEPSFKNLQAPRFHVRDVAIMRARHRGIPVVLGSATPSLETWHRSGQRADYQRLVLPRRIRDLPMPEVHVVDMDAEQAELKRQVSLSRLMDRGLAESLDRGEQAILLMNRRGFANRIFCPACRTRITCPNCNVNLVVHTTGSVSVCHYCRMRVPIPEICPQVTCGARLVQLGMGTQRIEKVLAERFPEARIRRVDSDTMRRRSDYEQVVADFEARRIDVLVGTQMIAKGLDFPFVSFVGVFEAVSGAFAGDFRAHERLFQLITQVAGRAGRADTPGRVVVQTGSADDVSALRHALSHDYEGFAAQELAMRRQVGWPPFRRLARIVVAHEREQTAAEATEALVQSIQQAAGRLTLAHSDVIGPSPCVLSRIRGKYRYELLMRTSSANDLRRLLDHLEESGKLRIKAAAMTLDVDPVDMA